MQGYVHRDVSCRNIMLCEDYDGKFSPHLIDFGLAYDMRTPPARWGYVLNNIPIAAMHLSEQCTCTHACM